MVNHASHNSAYTKRTDIHFVPPNSPSTDVYQHNQHTDFSLESPANAAMIEARIKDLESQQQHRFAQSRIEQPYAYPIQDIPETPRNHNRRGGTRTPLRLAAQQQTVNSPNIEGIQVSWARAQAQEPWYQGMPLGSPPSHMGPAPNHIMSHGSPPKTEMEPATVPFHTQSMADHDAYSTPHRPSAVFNAPPPSAIPIPYEWCSPEAAALPLPPPGFENAQLGSSASSSPRQSLLSYRSRADSEGSHYDSALSSHSPCSVHRDDGSLRLSISDGDAAPSLSSLPSSPALSTSSSLYTAASCMYCLPSDDNGYTNHLAATSSPGVVVPAAPQAEYDEDGYRMRPKQPSSPGFSYPFSRSGSNSSHQGLFCSSDDDGSSVVPEPVHGSIVVPPHHGPGPIGRPRSVEEQTSAFLKRRQERLLRANDDCLEEENIESMRFLVEAELLI